MGGGITRLRNNAFTLIELLAIIVILAIIAVITVPIILNIIENSRKGAATDSAYGYKDAVNKYYVTELSDNHNLMLNGQYDVLTGGVLNGSGITNKEIPVSGDKPSAGELHYANNTLQGGCLVIGDYEVVFTGSSVSSTTKGDCSDYDFSSSGSESGSGQGGGSTSATQYGFKTYDVVKGAVTEITIGTSGYAATGKKVYLKYALTNGEITEGTIPEACTYNETYGGELCLKYGESNYSSNADKIKTYFKWNEETNSSQYEDFVCYTNNLGSELEQFQCFNSDIMSALANKFGSVYTWDYSTGTYLLCRVEEDDADCFEDS